MVMFDEGYVLDFVSYCSVCSLLEGVERSFGEVIEFGSVWG